MQLHIGLGQETQPDSICAVGKGTHQAQVKAEPHLSSNVVLGQLVTEWIGLENGIVTACHSLSQLVFAANTLGPTKCSGSTVSTVVAYPVPR